MRHLFQRLLYASVQQTQTIDEVSRVSGPLKLLHYCRPLEKYLLLFGTSSSVPAPHRLLFGTHLAAYRGCVYLCSALLRMQYSTPSQQLDLWVVCTCSHLAEGTVSHAAVDEARLVALVVDYSIPRETVRRKAFQYLYRPNVARLSGTYSRMPP